LFEVKKNLTVMLRLDNTALKVCESDVQKLSECASVDKEDNGHLVSCLLTNKQNITTFQCRTFLSNIAALVFSDYRLVYNFIDDCSQDILKYSCGRIEKQGDDSPTQQGQTIRCLSRKFVELEDKCRKQIVRITELQSEDFHLDRALYFACREDRERFCEQIQSGNGRVYKCLLKHKFDRMMSKECQEELTTRQKIMNEDIEADRSLIIACKNDILKNECRKEFRNNKANDRTKLANVILCLEGAVRQGSKLEPECYAEILEHRKAIMSDYMINSNIETACKQEINHFCQGGVERGGKTMRCLIKNAKAFILKKNKNVASFSNQCLAEVIFIFTF
jgi:Golgi apparatus protein 1